MEKGLNLLQNALTEFHTQKPQASKGFETSDLIVFSHLRWDFVFQRPQHLMVRFAKHRRVFFFEEPIFGHTDEPRLHIKSAEGGVKSVVPHLPHGMTAAAVESELRVLVNELIEDEGIEDFSAWYYTPMALGFTRHLSPEVTVFDCMDELSMFKGAPPALLKNEQELMRMSDVVFTGGKSLYEAKKHQHHNIHSFPSSIDAAHFAQARKDSVVEPEDQKNIPHPRMGFFGVIDERMDIELVEGMAKARPDWHFVMIGPVVKIDPGSLPKLSNIHYLGQKSYKELPAYLAGWDLAIMPFARNDSTKFISPTKTPEYLAAGRPVVSTSIRDVIYPYAVEHLVHIADTAEDFVIKAEKALLERTDARWLARVDRFLADKSWDNTWKAIAGLESAARQRSHLARATKTVPAVSATSSSVSTAASSMMLPS